MKKPVLQPERKPGPAFSVRAENLRTRIFALREFAKLLGEGAADINAVASLLLSEKSIAGAEKLLNHVERFLLKRKLDQLSLSAGEKALHKKILLLKDELLPKDVGEAVLERVRLSIPSLEMKIRSRVFSEKKPLHSSDYSGST
ncbi:MAG: hypothetical protein WCT52_01475 [Candidatus Micrarchaeia archaeon]